MATYQSVLWNAHFPLTFSTSALIVGATIRVSICERFWDRAHHLTHGEEVSHAHNQF
jgi:hypothetical protein